MRHSPAWAVGQVNEDGGIGGISLTGQAAAEARARSRAVRKVRIVGFLRQGSEE
jgi:hypothetical protein